MNQQTTRPHTASDFLETAAHTLGERGKQYDPNGKQERSMTAICAAFNAIYPSSQLTVHMGWQFMALVKMVRGAAKPHADSALDQVAYAALAAEEVASHLHSQAPTTQQAVQPAAEPTKYYVVLSQPELYDAQKEFIMEQVLAGHTVQIMSDKTARKEHLEEAEEQPAQPVEAPEPYVDPMIGGQTGYGRWLRAEARAKVRQVPESLVAHNTDEPKAAPSTSYVDPFDSYGDVQRSPSEPAPLPRTVGSADPARGGLAYTQGKPLEPL